MESGMKTLSSALPYHRLEKVANYLDLSIEEILQHVQNRQINLLAYFSSTHGSAIFETAKTVYEADFPLERIAGTFGNQDTKLNISSIFVNGQELQGGCRIFEPRVPNTICYNVILSGLWYIGNELPLYFNYRSGSQDIVFPEEINIRTAPYTVLKKEDQEDSYYGEKFEYDELCIDKLAQINIDDLFLTLEDIYKLEESTGILPVSHTQADNKQTSSPELTLPSALPETTEDISVSEDIQPSDSYAQKKQNNKDNYVSNKTLLKVIYVFRNEFRELNAENIITETFQQFSDININIQDDRAVNGLESLLDNREKRDRLSGQRLRELIEKLYHLLLNKNNKQFNKESIIFLFETDNKRKSLSRATLNKILPKSKPEK